MRSSLTRLALTLSSASLISLAAGCAPNETPAAVETPAVTEAAQAADTATAPETPAAGGAVQVGALLPLTGALASYGETSKAALDDAIATLGKGQVELVTEDTNTVPETALEGLKALQSKGVRLVIGPYSSSEVRAVKDYADANGIVLISPLSTARGLAQPGDNLLRFTPDDQLEATAVAALAYADGIRTIVPVNRDDAGNQGLQEAFKPAFEALGGKVVTGLTYPATETDFKDEAGQIATALEQAGATGPAAVYLTAFSDATNLLGAAAEAGSVTLDQARWYGSDGVAQSKELVADPKAAAYASKADYPNPVLGLREADQAKWGPVSERLSQQLGRAPDAFALAAYDALDVSQQALGEAGADADAAALVAAITRIADGHTGLTGPTRLNEAGDRALGNYDFWSVCRSDTGWDWFRSATYTIGPDGSGTAARHEPTNCRRGS